MISEIENRPVFTTLKITLAEGESFKAEPGAMVSMSPAIEPESYRLRRAARKTDAFKKLKR
jgi:uncharacterized protein (AIM24 family)